MNSDEKMMYDFAYTLIRSAGLMLRNTTAKPVTGIREKSSHSDIVTDFDLLVEKYLTDEIRERYPDHAILAEESYNDTCRDSGCYLWIIDPIDGTTNYFCSGKDYAVSMALYKGVTPIFGLVYDVTGNIVFCGKHKECAAINGRILDKPRRLAKSLNKSVVAMSLRTIRDLSEMGIDVLGLLSGAMAHRYLGCASLELCRVAVGEYDLFFSSNVYEWDIAAARVILEQSGCHLRFAGRDNAGGKLFAVAYRSPEIWAEAGRYLPDTLLEKLG